jgi:hypothetical protein
MLHQPRPDHSLLAPRLSFSVDVNPVPNVRRTISDLDTVPFALPKVANDFPINQSHILQIQDGWRAIPFRRNDRRQFGKILFVDSTNERENNLSIGASQDPEHVRVHARQGPVQPSESMAFTGLSRVDFSPIVENPPRIVPVKTVAPTSSGD